jgi:hypothetical protein
VTLYLQAITIQHERSEIAVDMLLTIVTVYPVPRMQHTTAAKRPQLPRDGEVEPMELGLACV